MTNKQVAELAAAECVASVEVQGINQGWTNLCFASHMLPFLYAMTHNAHFVGARMLSMRTPIPCSHAGTSQVCGSPSPLTLLRSQSTGHHLL